MLKKEELANPESCWNKARMDERVFPILERDLAAPAAVRFWCFERVRLGLNRFDDPQIREALECAELMEQVTKADIETFNNKALQRAILTIESYQMDIRNVKLPAGATLAGSFDTHRISIDSDDKQVRTLADIGFCQGYMYLQAIDDIKRLAISKTEPCGTETGRFQSGHIDSHIQYNSVETKYDPCPALCLGTHILQPPANQGDIAQTMKHTCHDRRGHPGLHTFDCGFAYAGEMEEKT